MHKRVEGPGEMGWRVKPLLYKRSGRTETDRSG